MMTPFAMQMLEDGFAVIEDAIVCPDDSCRNEAVLSVLDNGTLVYICTCHCHILAFRDSQVPYWGCSKCGGTGLIVNELCDCWLPKPIEASYKNRDVDFSLVE